MSEPGFKLFLLAVHNLLRWAIVILAIYALVRTALGWLQQKKWSGTDQRAVSLFTISLDLQLLVGLLLYFIFSDLTKAAFADFGAAMGNQVLRFFAVEHSLLMAIAVAVAHIANSVGKKDLPDKLKFQRAAIFIVVAIALIAAGIPWTTRPLLPNF